MEAFATDALLQLPDPVAMIFASRWMRVVHTCKLRPTIAFSKLVCKLVFTMPLDMQLQMVAGFGQFLLPLLGKSLANVVVTQKHFSHLAKTARVLRSICDEWCALDEAISPGTCWTALSNVGVILGMDT